MASNDKIYFIVTAQPQSYSRIKPGSICYINKARYSRLKREKSSIPVICIGNVIDDPLPPEVLKELSKQQAELLLAVENNEERLKEFAKPESLNQAMCLDKDSEVLVELSGKWLKGVVRYIGRLSVFPNFDPIGGLFFGVELMGEDRGKGSSDGTYACKTYFYCPKRCGVFAPFSRIKPAHPTALGLRQESVKELNAAPTEGLSVGDRVVYFTDDEKDTRRGMVLELMDKDVLISTERGKNGMEGGEITIPLECVMKEEDFHKDETEKIDTSESPDMAKVQGPHSDITINSMVEVDLARGPACGTVRWIGNLPGMPGIMAGIELDDDLGVSDGSFKNERYFTCLPKRGLFVKLSSCRPDPRFLNNSAPNRHDDHDGLDLSSAPENVPPITSEDVRKVLIGRMKGIQGHCNSCYMDSALFSLFSCSSALDCLLFKDTKQKEEAAIQKTLLRDIVSTLRRDGFVAERSVMKLRKQLQNLGHCPSYTTDEKDPEEFLTLIMQNILALEPLLQLQSFNRTKIGRPVESSYFYQIFVDYDNSLVLPTVQQLLEHSFYNNSLRLAEVPSCLILTMPRSGKQFKMFPKIIPSIELDITALLSDGPQHCVICGQLADVECVACFRDELFSNTGFKVFCGKCSSQVHSHPQRQCHTPTSLSIPEGFHRSLSTGDVTRTPPREKLELFAVLCIETSHYVSFVKHGPQPSDWIFFDSMADRQGEKDGFNIPEVKPCPEVGRYLTMPLAELAKQAPRDMEGVSKRLFCDGYMYLYQSPTMALYR